MAEGESEAHYALTNSRQRLKLMCGGTLEIAPTGEGSVVTVRIPKA